MAPGPDKLEATPRPRRCRADSDPELPARVEAATVLLERGVDGERRRDDHAGQRLGEPDVHQDDVAVGGGEHRPRQPLPLLRDPGNLGARRVGDREIPGPPVLRLDRADHLTTGDQVEADLAEDVGLHDLAERGAVGPGHQDTGLHQFRRPGEHQHRPADVAHLEGVGEELVEVAEQPHGLLHRALPDLHDRADLPAVAVEHRILVGQLDELGLLVDQQHRLLVQRGPSDLRSGRRRHRGRWRRRRRRWSGPGGLLDVLGPDPAVPPAGACGAGRVGVPARRGRRLNHCGTVTGRRPRALPPSSLTGWRPPSRCTVREDAR